MKLSTLNQIDYLVDEFGRIIIEDKEILEHIYGYGELEVLTNFANSMCNSNALCGNAGCENLRC